MTDYGREMILFPEGHFEEGSIQESGRDFWERRRRHPEYVKLCEGVVFTEAGVPTLKWVRENLDASGEKSKRAKELIGIDQILDPSKSAREFDEINPSIIHTFGGAPVPVKAIAKEPDSSNDPARFVEDGRYLTIKVDLTEKDSRLLPLVKFYLEHFRQYTGNAHYKDGERSRFDKNEIYYQVWDERNQRTPFAKIAQKLRIREDAAKEYFYKAWALIMGETYDRERWNRLFPPTESKGQELAVGEVKYGGFDNSFESDPEARLLLEEVFEMCSNCLDKKCFKMLKTNLHEWTPCQGVEAYLRS
jgi:hypothetical protein